MKLQRGVGGVWFLIACLVLLQTTATTNASMTTAEMCYTGCAVLIVATFTVAGCVIGAILPALIQCNAALAICENACLVAFLAAH